MSNDLILPDSRLHDPVGTKMVDWELPAEYDGLGRRKKSRTVKIEVEMAYCINCGKPYAWVPKDNTVSLTALCAPCFETYGAIANLHVASDEEFCQDVGHELLARYGRALTDDELYNEIRDHNLGPALEALLRDSPFPALDNRPKR